MRAGFSGQELADILGVNIRSTTAVVDPALRKVARLMDADWLKFIQTIEPFIAELRAEREREHCNRLARANEGRIDKSELTGRGPFASRSRGADRAREQPATEGRPFAERGSDERATSRGG